MQAGTTIFIEGGFAKNKTYCRALAALCPDQDFVLTDVKEGTSFGAALTAWMAADNLSLEEIGEQFTIGTEAIPEIECGDIAAYRAAFYDLLGN